MLRILSALTCSIFAVLATPQAAFAQAAPGAGGNMLANIVPIIFMVVVMYFLIIRPQAKRQKQHQEFLVNLKRGDQVITSGGILGTIEGLTEQYVTLEIADQVRIKILKTQIASTMPTVGAEVKA
jgi:preprotein translocase subunit YajC